MTSEPYLGSVQIFGYTVLIQCLFFFQEITLKALSPKGSGVGVVSATLVSSSRKREVSEEEEEEEESEEEEEEEGESEEEEEEEKEPDVAKRVEEGIYSQSLEFMGRSNPNKVFSSGLTKINKDSLCFFRAVIFLSMHSPWSFPHWYSPPTPSSEFSYFFLPLIFRYLWSPIECNTIHTILYRQIIAPSSSYCLL